MKKRITAILLATIIAMAALSLTSCAAALDAPADIKVAQNTVTWTAVDNAKSYIVKILDGEEVRKMSAVSKTEYDLAPARLIPEKEYTIYIVAKAAGYQDAESVPEKFIYSGKLATPVNITVNQNEVTWNAVTGATLYDVTVKEGNNIKTGGTVDTASFSLSGAFTYGATYTVSIMAKSEEHIASDAGTRTFQYSVQSTLNAPDGIAIDGNSVTWPAVANATSYDIGIIRGIEVIRHETVSAPAYSFAGRGLVFGEQYIIIVAAKADGYIPAAAQKSFTYAIDLTTLSMPIDIFVNLNTLSWSAVANAVSYIITIKENETTIKTKIVSKSPYDLAEADLVYDTEYTVTIVAQAEGYYDSAPGTENFVYSVKGEITPEDFIPKKSITEGALYDKLNAITGAEMFYELDGGELFDVIDIVVNPDKVNIVAAFRAVIDGDKGIIIFETANLVQNVAGTQKWGILHMLIAVNDDGMIEGIVFDVADRSFTGVSGTQDFRGGPLNPANYAKYVIGKKWNEIPELANATIPTGGEYKEDTSSATFTFRGMLNAARRASEFFLDNTAALKAAEEVSPLGAIIY